MKPIPDCSAAQHYHRTKVSELRVLCQASLAEYNELRHECQEHRKMLVTLAQAYRAVDQKTIADILARFAELHLPPEEAGPEIGYFINIMDVRPGVEEPDTGKGAGFATETEARDDFDMRKGLYMAMPGRGLYLFELWIGGDLVDSFESDDAGYVAAVGALPPAIAAEGEKSCQ